MRIAAALTLGAVVAFATGCASTSAKPAFDDVAREVKARSGHTMKWDQGTDADREAEHAIDQILSRELTADGAVEVALLGSPRVRATLEDLAIAQADLVQAGLLKNPVFGFGRTAWDAEHITPNLFLSVEQDFLDVLTLPLRKRVAATELEATKLEVADEVLGLASEVREAFYTAQAAEQIAAMRRIIDDAQQTSSEIARRQHDAGNMSDLALTHELGLAARATLDRKRAEGAATEARENLNKRMGTWGPRTAWKLGAKLPELPNEEPPLDHLESVAIAERLDVGAARRNVEVAQHALSLAKTTRWTGTVNVNVEAGRLRKTKHFTFGPSVAIEIPLFDQRQAQIAKLEAAERQAENMLRAIAIDARADVRAARGKLVGSRGVVEHYGKVVVPLREDAVRFSQEQYDAMLLGVYQLIAAKQSEFDAYREYIEALRDYHIARSELERAVGVRLTTTAPPIQQSGAGAVALPPPAESPSNREKP